MSAVSERASSEPVIFISAAEPSADLHGASLIKAVHQIDPAVRFVGVAGPKMQRAGCEVIEDMTAHAAMAGGVIKLVPRALALLRKCKKRLNQQKFDLAIVIDSPTLNLPMAKHARNAGIPVLYFIAPQVWAWAEGRIRRLRARVRQLAVILPFEEEYFRGHGIQADYVGHPLFDSLAKRDIDQEKIKNIRDRGTPVVGILPGSRGHVASEVFPGQLEVAQAIQQAHPETHFCVSIANDKTEAIITPLLEKANINHSLHRNENGEVLSAADMVLVASGTATLETAYYNVPMIVMYNGSWLGYELAGRWLIKTKLFSLVNILAGKELVPEFMPYYKSTKPIIAKALELLDTPGKLDQMRSEIAATINPLVKTGASENTAKIVLELLSRLKAETATCVEENVVTES